MEVSCKWHAITKFIRINESCECWTMFRCSAGALMIHQADTLSVWIEFSSDLGYGQLRQSMKYVQTHAKPTTCMQLRTRSRLFMCSVIFHSRYYTVMSFGELTQPEQQGSFSPLLLKKMKRKQAIVWTRAALHCFRPWKLPALWTSEHFNHTEPSLQLCIFKYYWQLHRNGQRNINKNTFWTTKKQSKKLCSGRCDFSESSSTELLLPRPP